MMRLQLIIKNLLDYFFSFLLLILLSPVFLIIAVWIKIDNDGPIIFKQKRIGKNGKYFFILKFRSMIPNAENQGAGFAFEKDDPRITRPGRILRLTSLDELPQLINILKGDMSFVGPRPTLESQVKRYNSTHRQRLDMKPGITGWAQINGRNAISWSLRIQYDIEYIRNWSLLFDLRIIIKTIFVVFSKKGILTEQNLSEVDDL